MKYKKICIVAGAFPARSETFIVEHAVGLARLGHDISVVSQGVGDGITTEEINKIDISGVRRIYISNYNNNRIINFCYMVKRILRRPSLSKLLCKQWPWTRRELFLADEYSEVISNISPAVLHVHYGVWAGAILWFGLPVNTIITWHGYDANVLPRQRGAGMYKELFSGPYLHTVGSPFMENRLVELGCQRNNITRIPMGVDLEKFTYVTRESHSGCALRIISIGRLDEMKGHCYLIHAVAKLIADGLSVVLKIVGDGPLRSDLKAQIISYGAEDYITLLGGLTSDSVRQELEAADLFVLAGIEATNGRVETQGVALIEAQATGLPVVSTPVGGVPSSLIDGVTGTLCAPKDVTALVSAMKLYAENKGLRLEHGRAACEFVEKRFLLSKMLQDFEALYFVE